MIELLVLAAALGIGQLAAVRGPCPSDMVLVTTPGQRYCVDRYEASLVDDASGEALSPYYPAEAQSARRNFLVWRSESLLLGDASARALPVPELGDWQRTHRFEARAVSRASAVPNGYLNYTTAKGACARAGKRLCSADEWVRACRGERDLRFPYGGEYAAGQCNVHRASHPAAVLHADSSLGHQDPRLNLVAEPGGDPLLRVTGGTPACVSRWNHDGAFDMVGNLDEWIDDPDGTFLGGFYARPTTKGCDAAISSHAAGYSDYSTGVRCCRDAS